MNNLEGLNKEVSEKELEQKSIKVDESFNNNYDDCSIKNNEEERKKLEALKEDLMNFEDCIKEPTNEIEEDYEDCRKR